MSRLYLAPAPPGARNNWSCARGISRSDPVLPTVPLQCASNPFAQSHDRREPQLGARPGNIERAALGEEVYTAPIEGGRNAEGLAEHFARRAGEPERPHGEPH